MNEGMLFKRGLEERAGVGSKNIIDRQKARKRGEIERKRRAPGQVGWKEVG